MNISIFRNKTNFCMATIISLETKISRFFWVKIKLFTIFIANNENFIIFWDLTIVTYYQRLNSNLHNFPWKYWNFPRFLWHTLMVQTQFSAILIENIGSRDHCYILSWSKTSSFTILNEKFEKFRTFWDLTERNHWNMIEN